MRLRKKKHTAARMEACRGFILSESDTAAWCDAPRLALEIGAGKGGFIVEMARQNPDIHFIAVEKERDCIVMALEKAARAGVENVRFLAMDACRLRRVLPHGKFETIYLNFSDPWPKSKYAARRLTHRNMLRFFLPLLCDDGILKFKSDNDKLFDFTANEWKSLGFDTLFLTYDLHRESVPNVSTEYETRFSQAGVPIKSIWVRPNQGVFDKLDEYEHQKDRFLYHEMIFDLAALPGGQPERLFCALKKMNLPFFVRTSDASLAVMAAPLAEAVLAESDPLPRTEPEDTAYVSDRPRALQDAKAAGFHTIALGCDAPADEQAATADVSLVTLRAKE